MPILLQLRQLRCAAQTEGRRLLRVLLIRRRVMSAHSGYPEEKHTFRLLHSKVCFWHKADIIKISSTLNRALFQGFK
jgi:hypothetical protein